MHVCTVVFTFLQYYDTVYTVQYVCQYTILYQMILKKTIIYTADSKML